MTARSDDLDARLLGSVYPVVLRIVRGRSLDPGMVDDLAQEAMVRIIGSLASWRSDAPLEHWAARIAVNVCHDAARGRVRRPERRIEDLPPPQRAALAAAGRHEPVDAVASADLVDRLLAALSPRDRLVVHLLDLEERTVAEVAALTGSTAVGVRVRAFRARRRLRALVSRLIEESSHGT